MLSFLMGRQEDGYAADAITTEQVARIIEQAAELSIEAAGNRANRHESEST
jgi:hypothetical protein